MSRHEQRSGKLAGPLAACAGGGLPANVALAHLIAAAPRRRDLERAILRRMEDCLARGDGGGAHRLHQVLRLWRSAPAAWPLLRALAAAMAAPAAAADPVRRWAALFDAAVAISPEASVALYSLGRADLLERATDELVGLMAAWGLVGPGRVAVEIGCGIGRFLPPLAALGARVIGIDISPGMLTEASRRLRGIPGALALRGSGRDLGCLRDGCADLVYAVDVFPYLVAAGVAGIHVAEARRVLKPGGTLLAVNWSYRGDDAADRAEVAGLAAAHGFAVLDFGAASLETWDGRIFRLEREH